MYRKTARKMVIEFSSKTMDIRRQWENVFKVLRKNKNYQPRKLKPVKISFKNKT